MKHTTMPRRLATSACLVVLASALAVAAFAAPPQTAGEIVAASIEATGGDALDAVAAVRREGDLHLDSQIFGVLDGTWEVAFLPGKKGYQNANFGVGATATGWDGTTGWENGAMGLRDLDPGELAFNRIGWELGVLHALAREGMAAGMKRLDDDTVDGKPQYVLEYTDEAGGGMRIFVDQESLLVTRVATSIDNPQLGSAAATLTHTDYGDFEGVMLPQSTRQTIEGLWVIDTKYTKTEINPELEETIFAKP